MRDSKNRNKDKLKIEEYVRVEDYILEKNDLIEIVKDIEHPPTISVGEDLIYITKPVMITKNIMLEQGDMIKISTPKNSSDKLERINKNKFRVNENLTLGNRSIRKGNDIEIYNLRNDKEASLLEKQYQEEKLNEEIKKLREKLESIERRNNSGMLNQSKTNFNKLIGD